MTNLCAKKGSRIQKQGSFKHTNKQKKDPHHLSDNRD